MIASIYVVSLHCWVFVANASSDDELTQKKIILKTFLLESSATTFMNRSLGAVAEMCLNLGIEIINILLLLKLLLPLDQA